MRSQIGRWKPEYGTRLKGYFASERPRSKENNSRRQLKKHDDYDCLHDLECEGLVIAGTRMSDYADLTEKGRAFAAALRAHKGEGKHFYQFPYSDRYAELALKYEREEE